MPRPVTHRHVLRDLRHTINRTQAQFAKLLGVSAVYINKVENGQVHMSPPLAARIQILTGISIDELFKGPEGRLIDYIGREYLPETFNWWRKKLRQPGEMDAIASATARNLRWWTWILLRAAAIHHGGVAYNAVIAAVIQSLSAIRHDFGLEETTDKLLRECAPPVKWQPGARRPADLRQIERELQKELAQAEAQAQFFSEPGRRVYWRSPKPTKKQPSKKRRR